MPRRNRRRLMPLFSPSKRAGNWDQDRTAAGDPILQPMQGRGPAVNPDQVLPARVESHVVRSKPRGLYTWNCAYCGQTFETSHYGKRYCSSSCKYKAYRERKAQNS
jgi:hypothetical protein